MARIEGERRGTDYLRLARISCRRNFGCQGSVYRFRISLIGINDNSGK